MEENKINVGLINMECPEFLEKAATPPAKEAGRTLANIFYAIFSPINYNVEKLRIRNAENLKKYESDIRSELDKIPEDKLIDPQLSIVGPSLEASKFYIEDENVRKMFAKLIASSMNHDTYHKSHPSFVEIIKQLSPLDATNFKIISQKGSCPIAEYKASSTDGGGITANTHVFLSNPDVSDLNLIASSISNLIRLGLITVTYTSYLTDISHYKIFENHSVYISLVKEVENGKLSNPNYPYTSVEYTKGVVRATPFGSDFASICL